MTANDSKTKTYIKFDGKDSQKFCEWVLKVKAMGARQGWLDGLLKNMKLDRTITDKAEEMKVLMNDLAYHYLVMSCMDYVFDYVQAAEGVDSYGDAQKAWKDLCAHYNKVMAEDLISLTTEWNGCKLKKASNDPKLWYAELEHLQMLIEKAGAPRKTDVEVVAFIMSQILAEYKPVISALWVKPISKRLLALMKKVYSEYWSAKFKSIKQSKESDGNAALYTQGGTKPRNQKKFKGNCLYCSIQGYKQADCHKKKAAEKSGEEAPKTKKSGEETPKQEGDHSNKKHWQCREKGHIAKVCPLKKKNQQGNAFFVEMTLFSDDDIEPWTLRTRYKLECKTEVNHLDVAARLERLQAEMCLPHPGAAFLPSMHVAEDSVYNWIV